MGKFKVGDEVKVTKTTTFRRGTQIGDKGVITDIRNKAIFIDLHHPVDGIVHQIARADNIEHTITIEPGKHYRLRSGKVTGRVAQGDIGFEATVDGSTRVFDKAGGAVFGGGDDIVEAWVPKVGERVRFTDAVPSHWFFGPTTDNKEGVIKEYSTEDGMRFTVSIGDEFGFVDLKHIEPLPVAAPLQIQQGKFYKTRDGRKVGPMKTHLGGDGARYWIAPPDSRDFGHAWWKDGTFHRGMKHQMDIIAEWVDEPAAPVANDNAAPAAAKFKVGDRVKTDDVYSFDPNVGEIVSIEDGYINVKVDNDGYGGGLWAYGEEDLSANVAQQQSTTGFTIPLVDEDDAPAKLDELTVVISADTADAESALDTIIAKLERIAELQEQLGLRAA